jgi:hypothetical protein
MPSFAANVWDCTATESADGPVYEPFDDSACAQTGVPVAVDFVPVLAPGAGAASVSLPDVAAGHVVAVAVNAWLVWSTALTAWCPSVVTPVTDLPGDAAGGEAFAGLDDVDAACTTAPEAPMSANTAHPTVNVVSRPRTPNRAPPDRAMTAPHANSVPTPSTTRHTEAWYDHLMCTRIHNPERHRMANDFETYGRKT